MLFSSTVFLFAFLPVVIFGYYVIFRKSRLLQNIFLLIMSLIFYAWGEPKFVLVMMLSIIVNWALGLPAAKYRDNKVRARAVIAAAAVFNIGLMFIFKYLIFTLENINSVFGLQIPVPQITLPIGISFFTFQAFSYVIDVYRNDGEMQKNPLNVGLYISFFPQLIAGPIVRYQTVANEIKNRKETLSDFTTGVERFIVGFLKKVMLANTMAVVADAAFDAKDAISPSFAWLGALAYTFQIFFDFAGYSDMGIGLGRMFGFHFLENFDYPYISKSITEFWRRWHISLGTWFRDYVYFPLGGSRVNSKARLVFNLFVVWFLTGVWHGANWTFLVWGLMYFVILTVEKLSGIPKKEGRLLIIPKYIYTMLLVIFGWVIFRAESLGAAGEYFKAMFGFNGGTFISDDTVFYLKNNLVMFVASAVFSLPVAPLLRKKLMSAGERTRRAADAAYTAALLLMFVVAVSYMIKGTYNPFIYFNF
jgi:alginate O-acetyltransferase complex protein AlgI